MHCFFYVLIILIILDKTGYGSNKRGKKKPYRKIRLFEPINNKVQNTYSDQIGYAGLYTRVPLLTKREQKQYAYLKKIADEKKVLICPKVRLLDLVTPVHGVKNYKTLMRKVMSKHVDFVICTQEMHVLGIIELDDSTHLRQDRIERDEFVDTVLTSAGYKIKHVWEISNDVLDSFLDEATMPRVEVKIVSPTGWTWNENTKLWDPPENM